MRRFWRPLVAGFAFTTCASAAAVVNCTGYIDPASSDSPKPTVTNKQGRDATVGAPDAGAPSPPSEAGVPYPFEPVSAASAVGKVKNVLLGAPATDAEVLAVANALKNGGATSATAALKQLVTLWIAPPSGQTSLTPENLSPYQTKLLSFFANQFQQTEVALTDFTALNGTFPGGNGVLANLQQMFGLTVLQLLANGQPFADAITTNQFMMTPALMSYYALLDEEQTNNAGQVVDLALQANPSFSVKVTGKGSMSDYPIEKSLDPTSPTYLTFYSPLLNKSAYADGGLLTQSQWDECAAVDPWVLTSANAVAGGSAGVSDSLAFLLFGNFSAVQFALPSPVDGGASIKCASEHISYGESTQMLANGQLYIQPSDFTRWSLVTIRQPNPGESTTRFYDLPTLRSRGKGADLVLHTPRVGYFTTQSFFAGWATNASNQARVTMNQTMIVGLNHAFTGTDGVNLSTISLEALDSQHAPSSSGCFDCHQTLDPMRQFFLQNYSLFFSVQTDAGQIAVPGQFAFQGESQGGNNTLTDLAWLIRGHSEFPSAWVQKLCTYATSAVCDQSDPEFQRIVGVFQSSNYNFDTLVAELFSSPIVTLLTETFTSDQLGDTFPITRQGHLCAMLSQRLNIADVCGLLPSTAPRGDLGNVQTLAAVLPSDEYSRGSVVPVLANDPSLFYRSGLENICISVANTIIDTTAIDGGVTYSSKDPAAAISAFVTSLMGLTSDRAGTPTSGPLGILNAHYAKAVSATFDGGSALGASAALKSTFVLACESPYVAGMGQ